MLPSHNGMKGLEKVYPKTFASHLTTRTSFSDGKLSEATIHPNLPTKRLWVTGLKQLFLGLFCHTSKAIRPPKFQLLFRVSQERNSLSQRGQYRSGIHPHSSSSTRGLVGDQKLTSPLNNFFNSMNNLFHLSFTTHTINANDLSLLQPRSNLHVEVINIRTLCQIGQQALDCSLKSHANDVCCVSKMLIQDPKYGYSFDLTFLI